MLLAAFLIGAVAGLRTMTAPAAISWAAALGWLHLEGTPLALLGAALTPYIFSVLAVVELFADQLPTTPSRKTPMQFAARLSSGAICGSAIGLAAGAWLPGLAAGVAGAIVGTLGGAEIRRRLALALGRDLPAALLEDVLAILAAIVIVTEVVV